MPRYNNYYIFEVDDAPMERVLRLVDAAVSPTSLAGWLEMDVHDYLVEQIEHRFAYEGDAASGDWEDLAEPTERIRQAMGYSGSSPINIRTGALQEFVTEHYDLTPEVAGATLAIPGDPPNQELQEKIEAAQQGKPDNAIPGFGPTPARPVLATDAADMAHILGSLQVHVINVVVGGLV